MQISRLRPVLDAIRDYPSGPIPGGRLLHHFMQRPPTPLPSAADIASLESYLKDCKIQVLKQGGADPIDPSAYLAVQTRRLAVTSGFLPALDEQTPRILEVGAAPYLFSLIVLRRWAAELTAISCPFAIELEQALDDLRTVSAATPRGQVQFPVYYFNIERQPFPFPSDQYDLALFCEVIEHLVRDPMAVLSEINRVLKPGGWLLLATPNVARARALEMLHGGYAPYTWSAYSQYGAYGRHNREYAPREIAQLVTAAGFDVDVLATETCYAEPGARGEAGSLQRDTIIVRARKAGPVRQRLPAGWYDYDGFWRQRMALLERRSGADGSLDVRIRLTNTGAQTWVAAPPGKTYLGIQLWQPHATLVDLDFRAVNLPNDVSAGEAIDIAVTLPPVPATMHGGYYRLDLVKSGEFWFEWRGAQPLAIVP